MNKYIIDAENKSMGRVATEAAVFLMGKGLKDFKKNTVSDVEVLVKNASKAKIDEKKRLSKTYSVYSGYPGGLRQPSMDDVISKKGYAEVFRQAVSGMLPKNKLRVKMLKRLIVKE
ncbi:MAG: uL13 family ribosomal protein [Minisyncoccia bacterium]